MSQHQASEMLVHGRLGFLHQSTEAPLAGAIAVVLLGAEDVQPEAVRHR